MDSIQEVQVLEQSYSAQYGEALSAVINPITKSGTNQFHGSVFDYFRNEHLDANDFFNNANRFSAIAFPIESIRRQCQRTDHNRQVVLLYKL